MSEYVKEITQTEFEAEVAKSTLPVVLAFFFLVVAFVLAGILVIANLLDDHRPPGFVEEPVER